MDKGDILERGNHDELMEQKGEYYKLYMSPVSYTHLDVYKRQALREPCVCQMKSMPSSDLKEYSVRLTAMQILIQKLQNLASLDVYKRQHLYR